MVAIIVDWAVITVLVYIVVMGTAVLSYMIIQDLTRKGKR
jgi:hypothetical protein